MGSSPVLPVAALTQCHPQNTRALRLLEDRTVKPLATALVNPLVTARKYVLIDK